MLGKIYKITNHINGKIYVGQTVKSLKERFQKHCWGTTENDSYHLNMAIKKAIKNMVKKILLYIEYNFSTSVQTLASKVEG